jgi:UDP-glucose 4-epimerase
MGWKHVIPQFVVQAINCIDNDSFNFKIQGDGSETRSFCYVDDVVDGILKMYENGSHRQIYHIGNDHEISIRDLVGKVGKVMGVDLKIETGSIAEGGTPRRCPDISKMHKLGYSPKISIEEGLKRTADWYANNKEPTENNKLM